MDVSRRNISLVSGWLSMFRTSVRPLSKKSLSFMVHPRVYSLDNESLEDFEWYPVSMIKQSKFSKATLWFSHKC